MEKDTWEVIQILVQMVSVAAIPVILAVIGGKFNLNTQRQQGEQKLVELAVGVLQTDQKKQAIPALRKWAAEVVGKRSGVAMSQEAIDELSESPLSEVKELKAQHERLEMEIQTLRRKLNRAPTADDIKRWLIPIPPMRWAIGTVKHQDGTADSGFIRHVSDTEVLEMQPPEAGYRVMGGWRAFSADECPSDPRMFRTRAKLRCVMTLQPRSGLSEKMPEPKSLPVEAEVSLYHSDGDVTEANFGPILPAARE